MNQNLKTLVQALRSPMPEGFGWHFNYVNVDRATVCLPGCGSVGCAIGLTSRIFADYDSGYSDNAEFFGMTLADVDDIFYDDQVYVKRHGATDWADVTPAMVADEIESRYGKVLP
jgi:hypothetical protein